MSLKDLFVLGQYVLASIGGALVVVTLFWLWERAREARRIKSLYNRRFP